MSSDKPVVPFGNSSLSDLHAASSDAFFDPNSFSMALNFDEPDNENNMLRDENGQIKGASFAKIIAKMVDPHNFGTFLSSQTSFLD